MHLSGHSHYPLNDPRSVWQGEFTAIGTGALSYAELTVDGQNKIHPPGHEDIAQGWIVELDAQNRMRLRGYDSLSDTLQCEYLLDLSDPPHSFSFTPQALALRASPPAFAPDAAPRVLRADDGITVCIPEAACSDGAPVFLYRVALVDPAGTVLSQTVCIPEYWHTAASPLCATLPEPDGAYAVQVTAENAYGMCSPIIRKEMYSFNEDKA